MAEEQVMIAPPAEAELPKAGSVEYDKWRLTGELPAAVVEDTPSSPAGETSEAEGADAPTGAASEPAKSEKIETRSEKTARRFNEILKDNKRLEKEVAELQKSQRPAEAKPAPAADRTEKPAAGDDLKAKIDKVKAEFKAKQSTYTEYDDYVTDLNQAIADVKTEHRETQQKREAEERTARERAEQTVKTFSERKDAARKAHPDFNEVTKELGDPKVIPSGSVMEAWLLDSEVGAEMMYYLGQHREELTRIQALNPFAQSRALTKIEISLEPKSTPTTNDKKVTNAPEPPRVLGSGATPPDDAEDAAVKKGDVASFIAERNRQDLARGRRG